MTIAIRTAVERLIGAQSSRRLLPPLSETRGDFTLEHAYAIRMTDNRTPPAHETLSWYPSKL